MSASILRQLLALYFAIIYTEAATGGFLFEKVLLEISQNSQENTCARVSNTSGWLILYIAGNFQVVKSHY